MELNTVKLNGLVSDKQMTARQLARETGVTEAAIQRILKGKSRPRLDTIGKLARALGVHSAELFTA